MKYHFVKDGMKYYFATEELMHQASKNKLAASYKANVILDMRNGTIVKSRYTLEQILDNVDMDRFKFSNIEQEMREAKQKAITRLMANVCDNLSDMPISEEWAEKTARKIIQLLEMPEVTNRVKQYIELSQLFIQAQKQNNEAVEEELANKLDALWYSMYREELAAVEIITPYLVAENYSPAINN